MQEKNQVVIQRQRAPFPLLLLFVMTIASEDRIAHRVMIFDETGFVTVTLTRERDGIATGNDMDQALDQFLHYLVVERGLSANTIDAYGHDLVRFLDFAKKQGIQEVGKIDKYEVKGFLHSLQKQGLSARSRARNLVAVRTFFRFLVQEAILEANPVEDFESPEMVRALPETLTVKDVEKLLRQPDTRSPLGVRDRAMLEILYATGMRVSELVGLPVNQLNLEGGFVVLYGKGSKERAVPLGQEAIHWILVYLQTGRATLLKKKGQSVSLCRSLWHPDQQTGLLEDVKGLRSEGGDPEEDYPSSAPSQLCHTSFGGRSRPTFRPDDAGS